MKRYALVFLVAIFLPSLVLGWLALRTAGEQRVLIERQAADLHQAETDIIAADIRSAMEAKQTAFNEAVRTLVARQSPSALAENFGRILAEVWPDGGIPFAIDPHGQIAFPASSSATRDPKIETFLRDNAAFLSNRAPAEVYAPSAAAPSVSKNEKAAARASDKAVTGSSLKAKSAPAQRNIIPQRAAESKEADQASSRLAVEISDFQSAVGGAAQGTLSRFVQNELQVLFWARPDPGSNWLFGVMLGPRDLEAFVRHGLPATPPTGTQLAILNDRTRPVARSPRDFTAPWNRPFVASEIGEVLPHWEAALYLTDPDALAHSANLISTTLILLIALALAAILVGGYLVALDTRRQLALAQKKTDFVSNVSHELKTPLTSIRMFAELLTENRGVDDTKRARYLRIISAESERLTRLVNNVLDFARLERKRKTYDLVPLDVRPVIDRIWDMETTRLQEAGFITLREDEPGPFPLRSDTDAIAQILVNLISNAEKYHGDTREILLTTHRQAGTLRISVSDRGPGVPPGLESKIFEPFFRVNDSLAGDAQGSGLGLTLARRIARDLGGDLQYQPRPGGGSTFTLSLPLSS